MEDVLNQRRKKIILALVLVVIVAAIVGSWYFLQLKSQGGAPLAPDFSLTDLDGNAFRLSDFRGKVVVIDFMAVWCGFCRLEMPHLGTIWEKYENKIVLMSIDIDPYRETEEMLRDFAQEFPYATWIWAIDTASVYVQIRRTMGQDVSLIELPETVIIDQDGYIRFAHIGLTPASTFIQEIDQLLG